VAGQGVAIGRLPLLGELLREGKLVAPFPGAASHWGYFATLSPRSAGNADAQDFVRWLQAEAAQVLAAEAKMAGAQPRQTTRRPAKKEYQAR
jgi:LysR family glycine cleavage system transcriptional activator